MRKLLLLFAASLTVLPAQILPIGTNNYGHVLVDSSSRSASVNAASHSWSHTVGNGQNRLLIVWATHYAYSTTSVTAVTYNGVSLIRWDSFHALDLWYMVNPPSGAHTIAVTLSAGTFAISGAWSVSGADQFRPLDGWTPSASATATVTSHVPNTLLLDVFYLGDNRTASAATWGISSQFADAVLGQSIVFSTPTLAAAAGDNTNVVTVAAGSNQTRYIVAIQPAKSTPLLQSLGGTAAADSRLASWNWLDSRGGYYFQTLKGSKALYAYNATTLALAGSLVDATLFAGIEGVQTRGNYAYISVSLDSANSTASVIDISSILAGGSTMTNVAHITDTFLGTGATSTSCAFSHLSSVNSNLWFVGNGNGIMSIDITNPLAPVKISTLTTSVSPGALCAVWDGGWAGSPWDGNTLFVRGGKLDVTNPAAMAFVGGVDTCRENSVVYGAYAYAPCSGSIHIWNPVNMADLGTVSVSPSSPRVTTGDGRYLYAQDGSIASLIWVYDVHTNPLSPRIVDAVRTYSTQDDVRILPWSTLFWAGGPQTFAKMP